MSALRKTTSPARAAVRDPENIKLQMLHEVGLDTELPPASKVLALYLITAWWSGDACFRADEAASADTGMGVATVRRARRHARFLAYFEVTSGAGRAATIYRPTPAWISAARGRRDGGVKTTARLIPSGASVINMITPDDSKVIKMISQGDAKRSLEGGQNDHPFQLKNPEKNPIAAEAAHDRRNSSKELSGASEAGAEPDRLETLDRFLAAYPRPGDHDATEAALREALDAGADPETIIAAARAYAAEQAGNAPRYIAYSQNWLRQRRWEHHAPAKPADEAAVLAQRAEAVKARKPWVATMLSAHKAGELVARGLVTAEECRAAGVDL